MRMRKARGAKRLKERERERERENQSCPALQCLHVKP
jgi:hypothetical protein